MAAYSQGRAAPPGVTTVTTSSPQPQVDESYGAGLDDGELGRAGNKKVSMKLSLPGSQNARTMAGKAAKAARGSTKGATKMASAFGRKFGLGVRDAGGQHQAIPETSLGGQPSSIGREESDTLDNDDADAHVVGDVEAGWEEAAGEDTSALLYHAQYSPQSTPSTERPRSPECPDRSDYSSDCQESGPHSSDLHSQGTGSDSDAIGRSKSRPTLTPAQRREAETWDSKAFSNSKRPLECQSIWDIPTSRVPKPEPSPVTPSRASHEKGSRSLPKIAVSISSGAKNPMSPAPRHTGRSTAVVCLSLTLMAGAVVWAMLYMGNMLPE